VQAVLYLSKVLAYHPGHFLLDFMKIPRQMGIWLAVLVMEIVNRAQDQCLINVYRATAILMEYKQVTNFNATIVVTPQGHAGMYVRQTEQFLIVIRFLNHSI